MATTAAVREPQHAGTHPRAAVSIASQNARASTDHGARTLDLLVAALEHRDIRAAATAVVNRMAASFGARRVSLGMWNGNGVELLAVSGSAAFDASTGLSTAVRDAMHEAIVQRATLTVPNDPATASREDAAQHVLLRLCGAGAVCTVPFADGAAVSGAVWVVVGFGGGLALGGYLVWASWERRQPVAVNQKPMKRSVPHIECRAFKSDDFSECVVYRFGR